MDLLELKKLVDQGESDQLEFKESTNSRSLREAGEALCAFLNKKGGVVLFGVTNKNKIIGQEIGDKTKKEIAENILKYFDPHAPIEIRFVKVNKERAVIVLIAETEHSDPPYYFNKIAYCRSQATTQIMPPSMQQDLLDQKRWASKSWESLPASGFTIDDLDRSEISKAILEGIRHNRIPTDSDPNDTINALTAFKLIDALGQVNNAGAILFGKDPYRKYTQCLLRLARFRGKDKTEFIDNQQEYGNAFKTLKAIEDFCNRHLPIASYFVDYQMQRIDEPFLPPKAIREAVINAICHRDYTIQGSAINFAIYDDRIEIDSYGELLSKISIDQLKVQHGSYLRNPVIANVFYRRGMIEQWGRGTQQIVELCLSEGHPEPDFSEHAGLVTVSLYSKNPMETIREIPPRIKIALTHRQQQILKIMSAGKVFKLKEILGELSDPPAERTLRDDLAFLKKEGLIETSGTTKSTLWHLKK